MRSLTEVGANVPAFLGKLWKMVNDPQTNNLISWSPGGKTFIIKTQAEFARELLPLYYKHNNMASFIRQLNMYGFHKITSVENGGLRCDKDEIEFSHPCFVKGQCYLLEHIKRKIANPKSIVTSSEDGEKILLKPELMHKLLADVKQMKGKQENLDAKFSAMKQENESLWREISMLRQKHVKQQHVVNNLIKFLMSVVHSPRSQNPNLSGPNSGVKRPLQLMINNAAHNSGSDSSYPGGIKNIKLNSDVSPEDLLEDNEDGPTIHELAHDDVLQDDNTDDPLYPECYVTVSPNVPSTSPVDPALQMQYQVTMEDGDDVDSGNTTTYTGEQNNGLLRINIVPVSTSSSTAPISTVQETQVNPVCISPGTSKSKYRNTYSKHTSSKGKKVLNRNSFNSLNPSADLKLPAEIFASDDSVSDTGIVTNEEIQNDLQDSLIENLLTSSSKDKMLGGINIKLEKNDQDVSRTTNKKLKKSNKNNYGTLNLADIKTELQDDSDWNTMTLATLNNNADMNRFQSVNRRDRICKNFEEYSSLLGTNASDIDGHLDSMQTDLDSLRELLRSDSYALDTNTLMGLFGAEDPFYGLSFNADDRNKASNSAEGTQLMSYTGNIPDFEDINMPELDDEASQDACVLPSPSSSTLNTPLY